MEYEFRQIPQEALQFTVGECEFGDNGAEAKTAPFKMNARTGDAINHWFWGRLVHDNDGMQTHKGRVTIDYNHEADEVLGYANKLSIEEGDLIAKGVIQSYKEGDRAGEVIFRGKQGQPYEASISHDGDVLLEDVPEGFTAQVNGRDIEGPAVVVREWNLRGIAVCPYGADKNTITEFAELNDENKVTVRVVKLTETPEGLDMNENKEVQEVEAVEASEDLSEEETAVEADEQLNTDDSGEVQLSTEVEAVEAVETFDGEAVEETAVELEQVELTEGDDNQEEETAVDFNDEQVEGFSELTSAFLELTDEHGELLNSFSEVCGKLSDLEEANTELKSRLEALASTGEDAPVEFVAEPPSEEDAYAKKYDQYSKAHSPGVAAMAATIKLPK